MGLSVRLRRAGRRIPESIARQCPVAGRSGHWRKALAGRGRLLAKCPPGTGQIRRQPLTSRITSIHCPVRCPAG